MQINATAVRELLTLLFSDGELRTLCFDLGVDYESLPGQGKEDKARELVAYALRYGRSAELVAECRRRRPHADWHAVVQSTPSEQPHAEQRIVGAVAQRDLPSAHPRRRVFVSYKRDVQPDAALALELVAALRGHHDVFIDQEMLIGTRWAERIQAELGRCDALIVLLSALAVQSEMVREEIVTAHRLAQQHNGHPAILPVRVAYREPFSYPLRAYLDPLHWALWNSPQDTPELIAALEQALIGGTLPEIGAPSPPEAPHSPLPPRAALELPEGTMDVASPFYIERHGDPLALETIRRLGGILTIKGPRQVGKSSLLMRAMHAAEEADKRVAFLDFQFFDHAALADADIFYRQFCAALSDALDLEDRTEEFWSAPLGNPRRCTNYVSRYLLKELGEPLVLAMDEVERVFDTPFRSDFFSMLRGWYNDRARLPLWKRLDLALVTSTEPYQLIANLNQSPFNVGQVIDLEDFTPAQVADLNARHGTPFDPASSQQLVELLSGHPYLTRRALYLVASGQIAVADLFAEATDDNGPFRDHLRHHLFRLQERPELISGILQVVRKNTCDDERLFFRLRGAGLVRRQGHAVLPRCRLYTDYFRQHLAKS